MMRLFIFAFALLIPVSALAQTAPVQPQTRDLTNELMNLYVGPKDDSLVELEKAHRSTREISDWVSDIVASSLQFEVGKTNEKLLAVKKNFSDAGYKSYLAFLSAQSFSEALRAQKLKLSTVVNGSPLLIGQGSSGGRYAWAFEMPVIMTAQGQKAGQPINLRLQIGRSVNG
ncbi:MAG TPA: DotI/IcmL family type IV secretion protein, partial [Alphaproteobacteria bacterium]